MPAASETVKISDSLSTEALKDVSVVAKSVPAQLSSHLNLLQVARAHNDRRLVSRVLQHLPEIRRLLTANALISLLQNSSISSKHLYSLLLVSLYYLAPSY